MQAQRHLEQKERDARAEQVKPGAPASSVATEAGRLLALQQTMGNRAVARMLASSLEVTPADHAFERQAETAESALHRESQVLVGAPANASRRPSPLATGGGSALDGAVRRRLEPSLGSLESVRVHTGESADALTASLGGEALTHGSDVFVSRDHYRPGTEQGAELLAHEAAHATGAALASGRIHLKRTKKHLDFVRIKKKDTHIAREVTYRFLHAIGADKQAEKVITDQHGEQYDTYGHWWVEVGSLATAGDLSSWRPAKSYGWWPSQGVNLKQTLKIQTIPGVLNRNQPQDPHHGDRAEVEYHPVLEVDDAAAYVTVRDQVLNDVEAFARGFSGSWNWRLRWGKNCHTFVDRLKTKTKLHHQKSKSWLVGTGVAVAAPARKSFADISKAWENVRGFGFGAANYPRLLAVGVSLDDLAALSDDEKTRLISLINAGAAGWNRIKASELNDALGVAFGMPDVDVFTDRHVVNEDASEDGGGGGAVDVSAFLDVLETKKAYTLAADLVVGKFTGKAGSDIMVIAVEDDRVQIEFPIAAGGGRVWVEADTLAPALKLI